MSQFPFETPAEDAKRAAESGAVGYNYETDDELRNLELGEGAINPSSQRNGGAGGAGGMMPPMMGMMGRGGGTGAGAGAGSAGAMGAGMMGATSSRAGTVPMGAAGGGVGPGGVGAGGIGAGGVGASGIGGVGGLGNFPRTGGTIAAGASGSGYSPYGINPATGLPWKPTDPGYPPTSGIGVPPISVPPRSSLDDIKPPVVTTPGINPPGINPPGINPPSVETPRFEPPKVQNPGVNPPAPIKPPTDGINPPKPGETPDIKAPTHPGSPDPRLQAPDPANPKLETPSVQSPSVSAPTIPGGGPTGPGGGGPTGPGGGHDNSYSVDPAELSNTGKRWEALSEQMSKLSQDVSALKVELARFGLVNQPEANYRKTQERVEADAANASKAFADNNTKLNSSSRKFEETEDTNTERASRATEGRVNTPGFARSAGPIMSTRNTATIL